MADPTLEDIGGLPFTEAISNSLYNSPQNAPGLIPQPQTIPAQGGMPGPILGQPGGSQGGSSLQQISQATGLPIWLLFTPGGQAQAQGILHSKSQLGQEQRANQYLQLQQQQVNIQQKRLDMEMGQQVGTFLSNLNKLPKYLRGYYIELGVKELQKAGQQIPKDFADILKKADDEQTQQIADFYNAMNQRFKMGFTDISAAMKDPETFFKAVEEFRKMSELEAKQKNAEAFQNAFREGMTPETPVQPGVQPFTVPQGPVSPLPQTKAAAPEVMQAVDENAKRYNLNPQLLHAMAQVESGYDPTKVSPAGAQGVMQLMPATAEQRRVANPLDYRENIRGGAEHMAYLVQKYKGNIPLALAAYNAGEGAVEKYGGIPPYPETQGYVKKVMAATGRPFAQPTQEAPEEYQTRSAAIDKQLQQVDRILNNPGVLGALGEDAQRIRNSLEKRREALQREQQNIEARFKPEGGTPFKEWVSSHPVYGKYGNIGQMPQAVRAEAQSEFQDFQKAELAQQEAIKRRSQLVPNPEQIGPKGLPAGTTIGEVEQIRQQNPEMAEIWKPVDATDERDMRHLNGLYHATLRLEPLLRDPEVAKILFAFLEKPQGWFEKNKQRLTKGFTEKQIDALSQMSDIASQFRIARAGLSQTVSETINIKDLIPTEGEAGNTALFKIRSLAKNVANTSNDARKFYESGRKRVSGDYLPIPKFEPVTEEKKLTPQERLKSQVDNARKKYLQGGQGAEN